MTKSKKVIPQVFWIFPMTVLLISIVFIVGKIKYKHSEQLQLDSEICDIEKFRISEPVEINGKSYFIYKRNSINVPIPNATQNYIDSGVLMANDNKGNGCKTLLKVIDKTPSKNNVYEFYVENNMFYILLVDHLGAGSGEGNAKVLESSDSGESWTIKRCFYYTPEMKILTKDILSPSNNIEFLNSDDANCRNFSLETP